LLRFDMSEYMEKHSVARLIGAPPGYVGYEEGGQLTEALRRRPYSVVLLDEIEKAHHEVFNILLQIFDDGRITGSKGRVVNCKNALFIMTSNLGSDLLLERLEKNNEAVTKEKLLEIVMPMVRGHFRPEFLNRLDEILPFTPLTQEDLRAIVVLQLDELKKRLADRQSELSWSEAALDVLALKGYDPAFGARPLKRVIQSEVVNPLAKAVLEGELSESSHVELIFEDGEIGLSIRK
ncbi:MAG: AAA family ATPase, partial [Chlamydiia bacterium]|nr:AAA family ATPase [Chlamydiia bacterium]